MQTKVIDYKKTDLNNQYPTMFDFSQAQPKEVERKLPVHYFPTKEDK